MSISILALVWLLVGISIQNFIMNLVGPKEYQKAMHQKIYCIVLAVFFWPAFLAVCAYADRTT